MLYIKIHVSMKSLTVETTRMSSLNFGIVHRRQSKSGPGCSKLIMSLINVSLNFNREYLISFC